MLGLIDRGLASHVTGAEELFEQRLQELDVVDHLVRVQHLYDEHEAENDFTDRQILSPKRNARVLDASRMESEEISIVANDNPALDLSMGKLHLVGSTPQPGLFHSDDVNTAFAESLHNGPPRVRPCRA